MAIRPHILITGASSGIGAALAQRYAAPGISLALTARHGGRLDAVAHECGTRGAETVTRICDVRNAEEIRRFIDEVDERQPLTMVIANAGIGGELVLAGQAGESAEIVREIFETNVMGVFNTIVPLLPRFVARREGHVVIMSSLAAFVPLPDAPAYSASKAAIRVYGQALGPVLAPNNVRVTVVCPGFVDTPMSASLPGPRPLLWSAERAADAVAAGLALGKKEIAFPWQLSALASVIAHLPQSFVQSMRTRVRSRRK